MSALAARFRHAAAGVVDALSGRGRPGVELVRVDQPAPPPAPRTRMRMLRALPAPEWPICPRCRTRHEPRPHPAGGRGLAAVYGQQVLPDPDRPPPIGRDPGDTSSLVRDGFNPWRVHPAAVPPPPGPSTLRERLAGRLGQARQEPMT